MARRLTCEVLNVRDLLEISPWWPAGEGSVVNGFVDAEFRLVLQPFMTCALWVLANNTGFVWTEPCGEDFFSGIEANPTAAHGVLISSIRFGERWLNGVTGFLRGEQMFSALGEVVHVLEHGQIHR